MKNCGTLEERREAAVICCHRCYLLDPERLLEFKKLLLKISDTGAVFATSGEPRDLYHHGWFVHGMCSTSMRRHPAPTKRARIFRPGNRFGSRPKA